MDLFFEFAEQQWMLFGALAALIALLVVHESRKGGALLGVHELATLVNRDEGVVLDLRAEADFKQGHIANAVSTPHNQMSEDTASLERYRGAPLILVCRIGQHSGAVAKRLRMAGFERVYRLRGGMAEWSQQQMPLVSVGKRRAPKGGKGTKGAKGSKASKGARETA